MKKQLPTWSYFAALAGLIWSIIKTTVEIAAVIFVIYFIYLCVHYDVNAFELFNEGIIPFLTRIKET